MLPGVVAGSDSVLAMALAALGFAAETLGLLLILGFGICSVALPREPGLAVLFAPIAGLATALLANQWLTWFVPAPVALIVVGIPLASLSAAMAWRARSLLPSRTSIDWWPLIGLGVVNLVAYLASLAFVFRTGAFTLASYPADPIHLYAPAAQWFVNHRFLPGAPVPLMTPITPYLENMGARAMPGSTGTLDAGLSVLTGWPVHTVFDPLDVMLVLLVGLAVVALVQVGLGFSRLAGQVALLLLLANPLLGWAVLLGYQTELQSLPLLYGALALLVLAWRRTDVRLWILAAAMLAPLPAAYAPVALLAAVLIVPPALVVAVRRMASRRAPVRCGVIAGLGLGLLLSAPAAYWLLHGGAAVWLSFSNPANPAPGGVLHFYPLPYVVGTAPVTRYTMWLAPVFWDRGWALAGTAAGVVLLGMVGLGLIALLARRRYAEIGACAGGLAYLSCLALVLHTTYGFQKTAAYLAPAIMTLAAIGVVSSPSQLRHMLGFFAARWRRWPDLAATAMAVALAGVVALEIVSSIEEQLLAHAVGPSMSPAATQLVKLRSMVSPGASVLIYDPHDYRTSTPRYMLNDEAAAYALTGYANTSIVIVGPPNPNSQYYYSAFGSASGDVLAAATGFDFVLTSHSVAAKLSSSFRPIWRQADLDLVLVRRVPATRTTT